MPETIVINYFAGPGSGKSSLAAGLFYKLKSKGVNCELVQEFAKHLVWEQNFNTLKDQFYVTATQHYRQHILMNQIDVMITDSPLLLGLLYFPEDDPIISVAFETLVVQYFKKQNNMNFFIERKKKYNPIGRNQTEDEAKIIDQKTKDLLTKHDIPFVSVPGTIEGLEMIYNKITTEGISL